MATLLIREISQREKQEIDRLSLLDLKSLYTELGQQVGTLAPGEDPEASGEKWLNKKKAEIYDRICTQAQYCQFIKRNRNASTVQIIAALGDLLASIFGGLPVLNIAALVFKLGLDELCECE